MDGLASPSVELANGFTSLLYMLIHYADRETVDWWAAGGGRVWLLPAQYRDVGNVCGTGHVCGVAQAQRVAVCLKPAAQVLLLTRSFARAGLLPALEARLGQLLAGGTSAPALAAAVAAQTSRNNAVLTNTLAMCVGIGAQRTNELAVEAVNGRVGCRG